MDKLSGTQVLLIWLSYFLQVEHIQITEYPLKWATNPINWQDLKGQGEEGEIR